MVMAFLAIALYKNCFKMASNFHKMEKWNPAKLTFLQGVQYQRNTPYKECYGLRAIWFTLRVPIFHLLELAVRPAAIITSDIAQ
jgi:hypothetical protein